jgi:hypothetical protein
VCENIVDADELQTPVESVEDICFLGYELVVVVRYPDEVEKLVDAGIGLFQVFGRNEHTSQPDQRNHVGSRLALEMLNTSQVLLDIWALKIGVENVDAVMEGLWLHPKAIREVTHPVDEHLTAFDIERIWVVKTAQLLALC